MAIESKHVEPCDYPFRLDDDGNMINGCNDYVLEVCAHNDWIMPLIIKSLNLHDRLVEALEFAMPYVDDSLEPISDGGPILEEDLTTDQKDLRRLQALLAEAKVPR